MEGVRGGGEERAAERKGGRRREREEEEEGQAGGEELVQLLHVRLQSRVGVLPPPGAGRAVCLLLQASRVLPAEKTAH